MTFSYLISAPLNNEIAIAMLLTMFGWKVAALYIGFGLLVAIIGGIIIGSMGLEKEILIEVKPIEGELSIDEQQIAFKTRLKDAYDYTLDILQKIWLYVLIGVGAGAFIHGYVPTEFITSIAGGDNPFAVPLATLVGSTDVLKCCRGHASHRSAYIQRDADGNSIVIYDGDHRPLTA